MLNLSKKIQINNLYSWVANNLNKYFLSKDILMESNYLWISDSEKNTLNILKIFQNFWLKISKLESIYDIVNLFYNNKWKYIIDKDVLSLNIDNKEQFEFHNVFKISKNDNLSITELNKKFIDFGFSFKDYEEENCFKIMWDSFTFIDNLWNKLIVSFWDDEIDSIVYDWEVLDYFYIWKYSEISSIWFKKWVSDILKDYICESEILYILDNIDFYGEYDIVFPHLNNYLWFSTLWNLSDTKDLSYSDLNIKDIDDFRILLENKNKKRYIFTKNKKTIQNFLNLNNLDDVIVYETNLNNLKSFVWESELIVCDDNISRVFIKKRVNRSMSKNIDLLLQIKPWDFVVHIDHGIWVFREVLQKELWNIKKEYITIEYKNNDKLFVPITEVSRVSKYVWSENPKLTWLSTKEWEKKLSKVSKDIEKIANELLDIYAKRRLQKWHSFSSDKNQESKFFNSFEYEYTPDQFNVISEIYKDMESENPMDRLLSGDVWFWKTEVAFASIYKAIIWWRQAALVSPLVVLAYEHFEKAKDRFIDFPFNIEVVTRFEKQSVIKTVLEKLKKWQIDLIIWTHRLLSEDVKFKDLWLLVIDEEHKFWVKDKEKIKKFKGNIDILSMSATPIPRSLNMALNGIKQVSMLTTPPVWKQSVQTIVSSFDDDLILSACKREFDRWWQVFFIHNRVETISWLQSYLEKLLPWKSIVVAHWQLPWDTLEKKILEFKRKEHDVLLATTVVENGIDFRDVNTIFINDSVNFWISQIHQLRWRVWRWLNKWYCYLLFNKDKIKEDAAKRLKTIVDYSHLWAWFELAIKDLEIRWWWDILWIRQSGSTMDVWVSLFLEMLEDKVEEIKKDKSLLLEENTVKRIDASIDLDLESFIPDEYFSWELDKINFYRDIESVSDLSDLEDIVSDFKEINPKLSQSVVNLFDLLKLKIYSYNHKISKIKKVWINYQIDFKEESSLEDIRKFLDLDKNLNFFVVTPKTLRSSIKNFDSAEKFVQYLLLIFEHKIKPKIKLKYK